jgi:hypothetical protein
MPPAPILIAGGIVERSAPILRRDLVLLAALCGAVAR